MLSATPLRYATLPPLMPDCLAMPSSCHYAASCHLRHIRLYAATAITPLPLLTPRRFAAACIAIDARRHAFITPDLMPRPLRRAIATFAYCYVRHATPIFAIDAVIIAACHADI